MMATKKDTHSFIDCDVHILFKSLRDLAPYLAPEWRRYVTDTGYNGAGSVPYALPGVKGVAMADSLPPEGGPAGSSYEFMRQHYLERFPQSAFMLYGNWSPAIKHTQAEMQNALAVAFNDWMVDTWLEGHPGVYGSICLSRDPDVCVREIERLGDHPQIAQVAFTVSNFEWGDPIYHPVFEAAARHGLVCTFHVGAKTHCAVPEPRYFSSYHNGYPQAYMAQLIGLINNGVLPKFPDLKILFLEGGWTWLPHVMWRMDRDWRSTRVEIPWVTERPSHYIREQVWFGTQPLEEPDNPDHLTQMIEIAGLGERLVFASDYPHWDFDEPTRVLSRFPSELKQRIFIDNARELYGGQVDVAVEETAAAGATT